MTFYKGICYQPFPPGYDPSQANQTCIFFGSDIAYDPMAPLWGANYTSSKNSGCGGSGKPACRNDLQTLRDMGVDLIRLYDWEPRNHHLNFLDYCDTLGIKVLVPVSNYFVRPDKGLPDKDVQIPNLIRSFSNADGTDYHPAVAGIIIGNEPESNNFTAQNCVDFTTTWVNIEQSGFSGYREVPIGHPVDFGLYGGQYPCWGFWGPLLAGLGSVTTRNLNQRIFLAPQTYNDRTYLFENAEGSGQGYVDLTWAKYQKPILITEIGQDRTKPDYQNVVNGQLSGCIEYGNQHPDRLIGVCFFQFADKVWLTPGTSEASFGAFSHGTSFLCEITYGPDDFTHWEANCDGEQMSVDQLNPMPLYQVVKNNYTLTLLASEKWQSTQVQVPPNRQVTIEYLDGIWTPNPADGTCDAAGLSYLTAKDSYSLPGAPEGALIGRLGETGQPFLIGKKGGSPLNTSGQPQLLYLIINDDLPAKYGQGFADNTGQIRVRVSIND